MKASLITNLINVQYCCGFSGTHGYLIRTPRHQYLLTDARYALRAPDEVKGTRTEVIDMTDSLQKTVQTLCKKLRIKQLTIEAEHVTLRQYRGLKKVFRGIPLAPASGIIENMRICKKKQELEKLIHAQHITDQIFYSLKMILRAGMRETDISWKIQELAHRFGADDLSFPPIVAVNKNAASGHHKPGQTRLKKNDLLLLDFGVRYQGYCSDMTRTIFTGKPTPKQAHVYNLVLKAQKRGIQEVRAGAQGDAIDAATKKIITEAGFPPYDHGLGHGIGLEVHEAPTLSTRSKDMLKNNMVVTVEPGIYLPNRFGVRIEDMVLVKGQKAHVLPKSPKELREVRVAL